ncbi:ADP,ATP carrier protein 1 [Nitzschia inconspicua]|uniref:ADP,ATP carrier protein n=1 Tax=Nitzschia inconspicua TaxID=303405 RepID=A0A9K3L7X7_9STRA|nr:ADP,ATP carrier protein 1 [Nitzschia inconspicua]
MKIHCLSTVTSVGILLSAVGALVCQVEAFQSLHRHSQHQHLHPNGFCAPATSSAALTYVTSPLTTITTRRPLIQKYNNKQFHPNGRLAPHRMADVTASTDSKKGFWDNIKSVVPPAQERKKLIPLALMFFSILFNYTILRDTKDVLMVTAPKSGAEVIPFIKTYVNLPAAIGFTGIYASLTNRMEQKDVFYACVWLFLAFFSLFAILIYPNRAILHPNGFVDLLASHLPASFSAPLAIVRNWSFAVFYVMAEMWGSVVASLLFWGFANEVTTVDEAKKYYPLFGLFANVALIFSGQYVRWVSKMRSTLAPGVDAWAVSLQYLMGAVVVGGGVVLATFRHMQRNIIPTLDKITNGSAAAVAKTPKKKKPKMSMKESAKFLLSSRYIRDLAMLVISYGMCINIVEVSWKAKLKQAFPNPNEYSAFMGNFSSATGAITLIMMLLGRTIFAKFGWRVAALVTPINLGVTGLLFFALNIFSDFFAPLTSKIGTSPLMLAVIVGAAQNILSKSAKYSLFDPCKEMAYIPLDQESKTKGKAAIDVIGNPLGKSGGALIQQFLIFGLGSLSAATPYLGVILSGLIFLWIQSANSLAGQFNKAMEVDDDVVAEAVESREEQTSVEEGTE